MATADRTQVVFFCISLNIKMLSFHLLLLNIAHWTFNSTNVDSFHVNFYLVFSIKEILTLTLS